MDAPTPVPNPSSTAGTTPGAKSGRGSKPGARVSIGASSAYPESVTRLIDELSRLPGIGRRSAERLAFHILKTPGPTALALSRAIADVKERVSHCRVCYNLTDGRPGVGAGGGDAGGSLCAICAAAGREGGRDATCVMVVEQPKDLIALELTGTYKGLYHVLMGRISPLDGITAGDLTVADLLERVEDRTGAKNVGTPVSEVVLALNPTLEGDGTGLYLAQEIEKRGVKVTRLARGLPSGSQLEFASKAVLADAILGRRPM